MKNFKLFSAVFVVSIMISISFAQEGKSVKIGNQEWMTDNLNVETFRNGDMIPQAKTSGEWLQAGKEGQPAWCYYENDLEYGKIYGKLYNWYAVKDSRQLAPPGWHVASHDEWQILIDHDGGQEVAAGSLKETGMTHWKSPNKGATNKHGFSALPGGHRDPEGNFYNLGHYATFWSATACSKKNAWKRHMSRGDMKVYLDCFNKVAGFSVRCVRD